VGALPLVDGTVDRDARRESPPAAVQAEPRILQGKPVVATNEGDVRVILDEAAAEAEVAEELVAKPGALRRRLRRRLRWRLCRLGVLLRMGRRNAGTNQARNREHAMIEHGALSAPRSPLQSIDSGGGNDPRPERVADAPGHPFARRVAEPELAGHLPGGPGDQDHDDRVA